MGSQPKPGPSVVSKRMIAVIIVMLLVIIVPASIMSADLSTVVITIRNTEQNTDVEGHFSLYGLDIDYTSFVLDGGEEQSWSFKVGAGTGTLIVSYLYLGYDSYYDYDYHSVSVGFMDTTEVHVNLSYSPW